MSEPQLGAIGQIAIEVRDLERATAFYRDTLGLKFLFSAPPGLAFFAVDGVRLMLSAPEGEPAAAAGASHGRAGTIALYFKVDDIARSHAALVERGLSFTSPPHLVHQAPGFELWMAFFRDPEENLLALMHEKHF